MDTPLVSVIIPAKNAERFLGFCLEALRQQTYPSIEVIVIDNGSTDRTIEIAETYGVQVIQCVGSVTRARNCGAHAARGTYFLHIDSDMELNPNSIAQCVKEAERGADVVILPERNVARGFWMQAYSFHKELVQGMPGMEDGRFMHRSWYEKVGGHDESLPSAGDRDLFVRLSDAGARISSINAITLHHVEHLTIGDLYRKTTGYTRTSQSFVQKHGVERVSRRSEYVRLLATRWPRMLRSPIRAAGWLVLIGSFVLRDMVLRQALRRGATGSVIRSNA